MVDRTSDSYALYRKMRQAKAAWDIILYAPEYESEDVPDEINDPLSDAPTDALNAFLLEPVDRPVELLRKIRVFRDEEIWQGWSRCGAIVKELAADAERVFEALHTKASA